MLRLLYDTISCHVITLGYSMLYDTIRYDVMLCHVMLCLCYVREAELQLQPHEGHEEGADPPGTSSISHHVMLCCIIVYT